MLQARANARFLLRHPWQTALSALGVALGVAVVVAIDLATASAERAFLIAERTVAGSATHRIIGGPRGVPETLYADLRLEHGIHEAAPLIEGNVRLDSGDVLRVLGIDPLAEPGVRRYSPAPGSGQDALAARLMTDASAIALTPGTARRLGVDPGDSLPVRRDGAMYTLRVAGLLAPPDPVTREALDSVALMDIAAAQELLGLLGRLTRIDLVAPASDGRERWLARVREALPAGVRLAPAAEQAESRQVMLRAFELNLHALSLLALVVGMFMIYNTMTVSVVQRSRTLGLLRAVGVTRAGLFRAVIAEALALGMVATLAGFLLGVLLAQGLLGLVTRTINDLYFNVEVRSVTVGAASLLKGVALGMGATALSAAVPAWLAMRSPARVALQRSALEQGARRAVPWLAYAGIGFALTGIAVMALSDRSITAAFAGMFALIIGYAALCPLLTVHLCRLARAPAAALGGLPASMAVRGVTAGLSRTGVAITALAVAVSVTVGVGIMIDSFRATVDAWLSGYLRADVYISAVTHHDDPSLDPALPARLRNREGVEAVSVGRWVELPSAGEPTQVFALDVHRAGFAGFQLKDADTDAAWSAYRSGAVLVSEPYAWHRRLAPGGRVQLPTAGGSVNFPVAAVFQAYGSDRGVVVMSLDTYRRHFRDPTITSVGVYLQPGTEAESFVRRLRAGLDDAGSLEMRSAEALRQASLRVFDRTFAITGVLRMLAVVVAAVGVFSAMMTIQLERARDLAVLRAIGLTPAQLRAIVAGETGTMGVIAGVLALPLGVALALILVQVVNRRSFGWTMQVIVDPALLWQALGLAVIAALLGGVYPAWRMSRTAPAQVLREE